MTVLKSPVGSKRTGSTAEAPAAFSVTAGAAYIGVSRATAWRMIADGRLPSARLNGRTLLRRVDLDSLLERHVRTA